MTDIENGRTDTSDGDTGSIRNDSGPSATGGKSEGAGAQANPDMRSAAESGLDEADSLRAELAATSSKLDETHDRMLRLAAEFDNARKRWERERAEVRQFSIQEFARDLLPVIDAFDKAIGAIEQAGETFETEEGKKMAGIVEGVQIATKVFQDSIRKHGIERLPGKGAPFNPSYHNAVARVVDTSVQQDTVIDEFVPGYKIGERILRTAMVRVAVPD